MEHIGHKIRARREELHLTQQQLADRMGYKSKSTINKIEMGKADVSQSGVRRFADALSTTISYLMGWDDAIETIDVGQLLRFPVAAAIRAGFDGLAIERSDEAITVPQYLLHGCPPDEIIVTRVSGNSMYPKMLDGDAIIVHRQSSVDSGDVAVVVYNGEDATVKIVRYENGCDWMDLVPANPEYMTRRIQGADLQDCHVVGKVIGLIRDRI